MSEQPKVKENSLIIPWGEYLNKLEIENNHDIYFEVENMNSGDLVSLELIKKVDNSIIESYNTNITDNSDATIEINLNNLLEDNKDYLESKYYVINN